MTVVRTAAKRMIIFRNRSFLKMERIVLGVAEVTAVCGTYLKRNLGKEKLVFSGKLLQSQDSGVVRIQTSSTLMKHNLCAVEKNVILLWFHCQQVSQYKSKVHYILNNIDSSRKEEAGVIKKKF
jgi:hypothetical protein